MKKLLLVLTVVAMASFLFVGCIPSPAPAPDPDPDPDPPVVATATIAVATEWLDAATGKTYVKGGSREITVTFDAEVENPVVKVGAVVVPVFTLDNLVFKGTGAFVGPCDAVLITVGGVCDDLCAAKSVVVDSGLPFAELKATVAECECDTGFALTVTSDWTAALDCPPDDEGCCGDDCSGLASWNVKIYDEMPWEDCCAGDPCIDPIKEADGVACPVTITTECIDEVFTQDDGWVDFFSNHYWVIATLTDKVGNTISYYGEVYPDAATEGVLKFVSLYHDPTSLDCLCPAEDPALADDIIGDCDGTPTTECWVEPLEPCPEVIVVPAEPIVGQLATITIDYADAVKPDGAVAAYVGPAVKTLPLGIPEGAQELVLTQAGDVYTATYVFGQAGIDYIYVVDGCADCTPCKTGVTVSARVCPTIEVDDAVPYLDDMWLAEGDHDVTVTFASPIPIEQVRIFRVGNLSGDWENAIVPEDAVELIISTVDNLVYTATARFSASSDDCDEDYIIVQYGESCCPVICTEVFMVDDKAPCIELTAVVVDCSDCDTAYEVWITSDTCAYSDDECCESNLECCDNCLPFNWTLTVYYSEHQPFEEDCDECVLADCAEVVAEATGTDCSVDLNVFGCILDSEWEDKFEDEGTHFVVLTAVDLVGNSYTDYGVLEVNSGSIDAYLYDSSLEGDCAFYEYHDTDDYIMGDCDCD